ncbi:MAG: glutathione S-transferase family protein [Myxococcales bacterium]|nr:glutathione S-transferase family protein [Myxococcales bacterium]
MTPRLETTARCVATPRVLFAIEEASIDVELQVQQDGHFEQTYRQPGPRLVDGAFELFEGNAILRHIGRTASSAGLVPKDLQLRARMDQWIDFNVIRIGLPLVYGDVDEAMRHLGVLDSALADRDYLCGSFSLADCAYATMLVVGDGFPRARFENLDAYLTRLAARPAWARVLERLRR